MTVSQYKEEFKNALGAIYDASEVGAMFNALLGARLAVPMYKIVAQGDMAIPSEVEATLRNDLKALSSGRPLQYVLGWQEFCGHRIRVAEGCLIPRPETEEMVQAIVASLEKRGIPEEGFNILDMCTGSGCIAWSLAAAFPSAQVFACDISDAALGIACRQRVHLHGAKPVFFKADVLQNPPAGLPKFGLIVANPPYIAESERDAMHRNVLEFEPSEALFVPDSDPVRFYRAVASWAGKLLSPGGEVWCEINERFGAETSDALGRGVSILKDINGKDRFIRKV